MKFLSFKNIDNVSFFSYHPPNPYYSPSPRTKDLACGHQFEASNLKAFVKRGSQNKLKTLGMV